MRLSKRCEYGIKAAVRLAMRYGSGYLQSREIAETEQLPAKFLESILLALRSGGMLESKVGAGGGYRLSRSPDQIIVADLIAVLDGADSADACDGNPIPGQQGLEYLYERIDSAMHEACGELSLAELASAAQSRCTPVAAAHH